MRGSRLLLGLALCLLPRLATGGTIFVSSSFSGTPAMAFITPFNHNLGTLDSVAVTINGQISGMVVTFPNIDPFAGPIPTPFTVTATQDFSGDPGHSLFEFLLPATFMFTGVGSGAGEQQPVLLPFTYTFHFNATTDLSGFAPVPATGPLIPPGLVSGTRADFIDTLSPVMFETIISSAGTGTFATPLFFSSNGAIVVEYDYTPAPPQPVPEPASMLLLGAGLAGLAGAIRRKVAS